MKAATTGTHDRLRLLDALSRASYQHRSRWGSIPLPQILAWGRRCKLTDTQTREVLGELVAAGEVERVDGETLGYRPTHAPLESIGKGTQAHAPTIVCQLLERRRGIWLPCGWIAKKADLSPSQARLVLKQLTTAGTVERRGEGSTTRYRLP